MTNRLVVVCAVIVLMMTPLVSAETRIVLDDSDSGRVFEGIGAISQGGS